MAEYQKKELNEIEDDLFEGQWDANVTKHFAVREAADMFMDHKDVIKEVVRIAKVDLSADFGGVNAPTNQFGWTPIQANHLLATSTPTYATSTWNRYIDTSDVTSRYNDWIGSSSSNLKLSKYSTMVIIGFVDPVDEPKIDGVLAKVNSQNYPLWHFGQAMQETDQHVYELASPIIIESEQELYLQTLCGRAGLDKLQPVGVHFGMGDYLRNKNAYAQT